MAARNSEKSALRGELPEIFVSTTRVSATTTRMLAAGEIRRIAGSLYTRDLTTPLEVLVPTRLREIIAATRPGAVVSARSAALVASPTADGSVFRPNVMCPFPVASRCVQRQARAWSRATSSWCRGSGWPAKPASCSST